MPLTALALVLAAALAHATWNLAAKHAGGGVEFVWAAMAVSAVALLPVALTALALDPHRLRAAGVALMGASALLHGGYFLLVQRGYRFGDLSLVYPLARGTGPLIATLVAIPLFGERPSPVTLAGGALIVGAVLSIAGSPARLLASNARPATLSALATGVVIAAYTLTDKEAVGPLNQSPLVYYGGTALILAALLLPVAARRRRAVVGTWRRHRREVLAVGLLSPLAYLLVLYALALTAVAFVAPAREVSILFGALLGTQLLGERDARRRLVAAGAIVAGVVLLAVG